MHQARSEKEILLQLKTHANFMGKSVKTITKQENMEKGQFYQFFRLVSLRPEDEAGDTSECDPDPTSWLKVLERVSSVNLRRVCVVSIVDFLELPNIDKEESICNKRGQITGFVETDPTKNRRQVRLMHEITDDLTPKFICTAFGENRKRK